MYKWVLTHLISPADPLFGQLTVQIHDNNKNTNNDDNNNDQSFSTQTACGFDPKTAVSFFFQNLIWFSNINPCKRDITMWNWSNTMNT